jgi:flavoprotein
MKRLNVYVSEEAHEVIRLYQIKNNHKTRDAAVDAFVLEKGKE